MKFSVLMPVYIKENPEYLNMSLESILINQSVLPSEVVIVKDGPVTDGINNILDFYKNIYPNILCCYQLDKNMGMGYAMNFGLEKCSHEWVFRMDSDDIARPDRFKIQLNIIENNNFDVIGSSISEFIDYIGDISQYRVLPQNHHDIIKMMKYRNPINHMTVAFKRDKAILSGGYWDLRAFEDYNLWYEMYKSNSKFYNIKEVLVDARIGNKMINRRTGYKYFLFELILLKKFRLNGFISNLQFLLLLFTKFIARLIPVFFLKHFYIKFLRNRTI